MPGLDKARFVGLLPEMEDEFTCGICHGIFSEPVVVACCQVTFCRDCISEWIQTNHNCPNDRAQLYANQLSPAPRNMTNILAKFQIKCRYFDDGCPVVCLLELEENHIRAHCEYNPERRCQKCGGFKDLNSEHDCIRQMSELVRSAGESSRDVLSAVTELRESIDTSIACGQIEVMGLRTDVDNLTKREQEFVTRLDNLSVTVNSLLSKVVRLETDFNRIRCSDESNAQDMAIDQIMNG